MTAPFSGRTDTIHTLDELFVALVAAAERENDERDALVAENEMLRAALRATVNEVSGGLVAENEMLRAALRAILNEVTPGHVPYSSDSYLPSHLVEQALAALSNGGKS